jgi:RNA polymerase sigma factor (sigma-70 family)
MVGDILDHWFRHEYGKLVSIFLSKYGSHQIDLIEDAIHEALYKAMMLWGYKQIPDNPAGWIYRVAHNNLRDQFRRKNYDIRIPDQDTIDESEPSLADIDDNTLRLIFACCHPLLKKNERVILCLKFAAGFSLHEISRALFISYEATKKQFQRAKKHFRALNLSIQIPQNKQLTDRLDSVYKVIFLIFTEGYRPTEGDHVLKEDLCIEALKIAMLLYKHKPLINTKLEALISLMCFKCARIEARVANGQRFIRLEDQNRELWSKELIEEGNKYLFRAFRKENHSEYHFHAAIESQYVNVNSFEDINWNGLLNIYNYWRRFTVNPALELNRIVVVLHARGAEEALSELQQNCPGQKDHLYFAIRGEILSKLGKNQEARSCYNQAEKLSRNKVEKAYFNSLFENTSTSLSG